MELPCLLQGEQGGQGAERRSELRPRGAQAPHSQSRRLSRPPGPREQSTGPSAPSRLSTAQHVRMPSLPGLNCKGAAFNLMVHSFLHTCWQSSHHLLLQCPNGLGKLIRNLGGQLGFSWLGGKFHEIYRLCGHGEERPKKQDFDIFLLYEK